MSSPEQALRPQDVYTGMLFYFADNPNPAEPLFQTLDDGEVDRSVPWMIIGWEYVTKLSGGYWRYWLLGELADGPRVIWHDGCLGWIQRVA